MDLFSNILEPIELTHRFALWFRLTRKHKWQVVGTAATERELVHGMVGSSDFLILAVGKEPGP